jgi:hypothetical protein
MSEHTSNASCATCHKLMDGVGFGLEKFDAVGARRDQLTLEFRGAAQEGEGEGHSRHLAARKVTLPLDTTAFVAGIPDSQFTSPQELGAVLAKSSQCQECVVRQYFRFQAGRPDAAMDRPLIRSVSENFRNSGFHFKELIVSLMVQREFSAVDSRQSASNQGQSSPRRGELQHVSDNHGPR